MADVNRITVIFPDREPRSFILDVYLRRASAGDERVMFGGGNSARSSVVVRMGRGEKHGHDPSAPNNDIVIPAEKIFEFVSRAQCSFHYINGRWFVVDDNSTNGMSFQNRQFRVMELHDGDKLYIGEQLEKRIAVLFSCTDDGREEQLDSHFVGRSGQFLIGRDPSCDLVISHPTVSRRHCVITQEGGQYYIADCGSRNGLLLNGVPLVRKQPLGQMDKISIADTTLFFSGGQLYSSRPEGGVSVSAEGLFKQVGKRGHEKYITKDVNLSIKPNEFVAIIGGSGAGKTTLLDCLSGMTDFTEGEVLINGEYIRTAGKNLRSLMGYVPQKDIVYDSLSLERMLYYSALLRMPKDTSKEEILNKIDETLETVELSEHRDTLISKLSGGQRKRASIAVELLASPKLFFLDEPSSGLDPGTEKHLMQMLKHLSDTGKTVVMVTHTVQNIDMCDRLICMGKGGLLCYSGPPSEAGKFFGKKRLTDIYDDLNENAEAIARRWDAYSTYGSQSADPGADGVPARQKQALLRQFLVMTARYAEIMKNSLPRLLLLLFLPVLLTVLVCIAYQADGGLYDLFNVDIVRVTFPFLVANDTMSLISAFSSAAFWIGIFNSIQEISKERNIFEREKFTGVASLPYVMSKFVILTVLCMVQSAIMTEMLWLLSSTVATVDSTIDAVTDMAFGMWDTGIIFSGGAFWLELFLTTFLCAMSAMCLGLAISALVSNDMALVVCPICLLPQILFSGVATKLVSFTDTISRIVTCRWSCIAYLTSVGVNEMYLGYEYDAGWAPTYDGETFFDAAYAADKTYLFDLNPVGSAWLAMGIICLVCVTATVVILILRKRNSR